MPPIQNDADVERLVQRSAAFRVVRAGLAAVDASFASSAARRVLPGWVSRRSLGILLLTASLTHALLETLLPPALAPAGRYLFAVAGGVAGALLLAASRRDHI
jgi:hypothetical protein